MVTKSQTTISGENIKEIRSLRSLEKPIQKRKSTLKKSASQLEILCGAQVCCVLVGPTGNVEVWPENPADAVSIIAKYKQCKKKTKVCREVNRSKTVEQFEENKGLAMGDDDIDQSMNTLENYEEDKGFDIDQFLNNTMENLEDQNKGIDMGDDIDQFLMNNTRENVEPNNGFDTDHDFDQFLNDFFGDTNDLKVGFPECSTSNAHMPTPGFEDHQIDNVCGVWPWETLWSTPQYSGFDGAYYLPKFENDVFLCQEQPKLMGSNQTFRDIGSN